MNNEFDKNPSIGEKRRRQAEFDFQKASIFAAQNGLKLSTFGRHGIHYRLQKGNVWIKDLYPTSLRIYCPDKQREGPFLPLQGVVWSLMDVVKSAIEDENK